MSEKRERVLVTGGNGFVGSHIVDVLLERGYAVRCLVRRTSRLEFLPERGVELVYGEITDPSSLPPAVDGASLVIHSAGAVTAPNDDAYHRVNADGTAHLAAAAGASGSVRRLVLVSSLAAAGPSTRERPRMESDPEAPTGAYGRSKLAGERALREGSHGVAWTVVRPPAVYGPRDASLLKLLRLVARGRAPRIGEGQPVSMIEVGDLARGILSAAESEAAVGRTYYLTHEEPTTWAAIGRLAAEGLGCAYREVPVPTGLLVPAARISGLWARLRGRPNPYPVDRIRDLLEPAWTCTGTRSSAELGFTARVPHAEGIPATVRWYRERGWV